MIGYLRPVAMTPVHLDLYRSYLCGLCHTVGDRYGLRYRALVNADLVFYGLLLDLLGDGPAPATKRACVLLPAMRGRPSRVATDQLQLAAAVGVTLVGEKLVDDAEDEGGPHRRLAAWLTRDGREQAADHLVQAGFPLAELRAWMHVQRRLESLPTLSLAQAAAPTQAIASLVFGFAGRHRPDARRWRAVGSAVGGFLFFMDNLLDFPKDLAAGGYNALARAHGIHSARPMPGTVLDEGLAGAEAAVERLRGLLRGVRLPHGSYLAHTLVAGFEDKIARFRTRDASRRPKATLSSIVPRRPGMTPREQLRRLTQSSWNQVWVGARVAVGSLAMLLLPRTLWAAWWPDQQLAPPPGLGLDTGLAVQQLPPLEDTGLIEGLDLLRTSGDLLPASDSAGAEALCASFGLCDPGNECATYCDQECCGPACDSACDGACDGVDCGC